MRKNSANVSIMGAVLLPCCSMGVVLAFFFLLCGACFAAEGEHAGAFSLPKVDKALFNYPNKDLTISLPGSLPGQEDLYLPLAKPYLKSITQRYTLNLVPVPGRGGGYAVNALLQQPDDGYSLALFSVPSFFLQTYNDSDRLYTLKDVAPVAVFGKMPLALWVPEKSPFASISDLARTAEHSAPGELLICGSGRFTGHHMASLMFDRATGAVSTFLPRPDIRGCMDTALAGQAHALWAGALAPETMPGMRPLAVAADTRSEVLPEIPTFQEAGLDIVLLQYSGLAVLSSTNEATQKSVAVFLERILSSPGFQAILSGKGISPLWVPLQDIPGFMRQEEAKVEVLRDDYPMFGEE